MTQLRPVWHSLFLAVLVVVVAGCDQVAPQQRWGIGDIPADLSLEHVRRGADEAGEQGELKAGEDPAGPVAREEGRRKRRGGFSLPVDDAFTNETESGEIDRLSDPLPSETERWGPEREMPSDSMPSRTERWGRDREMPSDEMPSRSFPSFHREPLPSELSERDSDSSSNSAPVESSGDTDE